MMIVMHVRRIGINNVVQSRSWEFAPVLFCHNTANFRPIFMKNDMYVYLLYTKKYVPKKIQKFPNLGKFWNWHKTLKANLAPTKNEYMNPIKIFLCTNYLKLSLLF